MSTEAQERLDRWLIYLTCRYGRDFDESNPAALDNAMACWERGEEPPSDE